MASGCTTGCTPVDSGTFTIPAPPTATPTGPALAASYSSNPPTSWDTGQTQLYNVTVTNTGSQTWNAGGSNPVHLGIHFGTSSDGIGDGWATDQRFTLAGDVPPGGSQTLTVAVVAPTTPGAYVLRARMVKESVAWFDQIQKTTVAVAPPLPGVVPIQNNGFEAPPLGGGYQYNPTGAFWTFTASSTNGGSGVTGNGSGFTGGSPNAPEGSQVAFLQQQGSFQQTIGPFQAGVSYVLSFAAAQRAGNGQDFQVTLDGAPLGTFKPAGTGYATYATLPFTATAGSHTLAFVGLDTAGGDNTAFIDAVRVATLIPNSGFEAPALGGGYQYTPSGARWVFGANPSAAGITGNGSGFTVGNPNAPEGVQAAFLQGTGNFHQSIGPLRAGTAYALIFAAAQRGICCAANGSAEDFQVLLDGAPLGAFKPASTSYTYLTTGVFTTTTGMHTLTFTGLDTAGGDNTAFIDDVRLLTYPAPVGAAGVIPWHPHQGVRFAGRLSASVDLADGHVDVSTDDLSIPGRGPDLALGHTWDSALAAAGVAGASGAGWQSSLTPSMGGQLQGTVVYTDSSGAVWPFVYTGALGATGPYTAYAVAPGRPWQLTASTAGYTLTNFLTSETMAFDAQGRYLSATDAYGNQNSMTQGANGPAKETNSGGRALAFTYNNGLLADAQSPLWQQGGSGAAGSQRVAYGYTNGQLSSLTWGAGTGDATTAAFGYTGNLLTGVTTGAGRRWALAYDAAGRVASVTSPVSGTAGQAGYTPAYTTAFTYGVTQTVVVEGYGTSAALTHTYTLDAQGEATATQDGRGDTSYRAYDGDHDATTTTDADGNTTMNVYQYVGPNGDVGLLAKTVQPPIQAYSPLAGAPITPTTTYRYSPTTDDLIEVDKPAGGITRYSYDGHHAISATTELTATSPTPLWRGTVDHYDQYGERIATTDGRGVSVDQNGTAMLTDPNGLYTRHTAYDAQGDQVSESAPPLTTTLNGYTGTLPVVTLDAYDADGNRTAATAANRNTTLYGYDHLGRQVTTTEPAVALSGAPLVVTPTVALNSGGGAAGGFGADTDSSGGNTDSTGAAIDASGVLSPAPQAVYQSRHYGASVGYAIAGLTPGAAYRVRLHFADYLKTGPGQRLFTVAINGAPVLTTFDIIAAAGAPNRAIVEEVTVNADSGGRIGLQFSGVLDNAQVNGIEVIPTTAIRETTGYDAEGNAVRTTDARGAVTTSSYDPLGRQVATTNPVSGTSITTYNATEQISTQDAQGNVTRESYDAAGRLLQATDAVTGTVQYGYDAAGNTLAITTGDTSGNVIQVETRQYDALNRAITDTVAGPNGASPQTTTTRYDPDGNVSQVNQPTGTTTVDTYDLADQLVTSETDGAPVASATGLNQTTYRYDAAGNLRATVDPDGRATTTTYDGDSRVTQSVDITGTTTITTTNQYDPDGNTLQTTTQTQGSDGSTQTSVTTDAYNAADWTTSETVDGATTTLGYDAAGQVRGETPPGVVGAVTRALDPEGREVGLSEAISGTTPATSTTGYNADDLPISWTVPGGTGGVRESVQYDANNNVTQVTATGPGGATGNATRALARAAQSTAYNPAAVTNPTLNSTYRYGYDSAQRINSLTTISGTDTLGYNAQGRLASDCGPQVVAVGGCYTYQYDGNGNSTVGVNRDGHLNHGLYNGLNELVQGYTESYPATATVSYGYDAAGDTTAITTPVGLTNPTDPHALNTHFQYDAQGRLTAATYLAKGALVTLTQAYNAQGQRSRYSLSSNGAPALDTLFTYDAAGHVSQETVVTTTATGPKLIFDNLYVYTQDGRPWMFLHTDPTTTPATVPYWYTLDGQGDVVAVTDQGGAVVDRYAYNQWGRETGNDATDEEVPQQLRYRGLYYDEQPARYWMSDNRAYDPALERYLQPAAGTRDYTFAKDNPANSTDSSNYSGGSGENEGAPLGEEPPPEAQWEMPSLPPYATEENLQALIEDTNKFGVGNRLRYINALRALRGPAGTTRVEVAGGGGAGGDIRFYDGDRLLLRREIKALAPSSKGLGQGISEGAREINQEGEIWIQIHGPEQLNPGQFGERQFALQRQINGFRSVPGRTITSYSRIRLTVFDTEGRLYVYNDPVGPELVGPPPPLPPK